MKKGQFSVEASIILGVLMFFFIFFIAGMGKVLIGVNDETAAKEVSDVADQLESELRSASYYEDGFIRNITLPANVRGSDYTVEFSGKSATRSDFTQIRISIPSGYSTVRQLPGNIEGGGIIPKGQSITIRKQGGLLGICPGKSPQDCIPASPPPHSSGPDPSCRRPAARPDSYRHAAPLFALLRINMEHHKNELRILKRQPDNPPPL